MRELLDYAGGIRDGHELKFFVVGGSSVPMLTQDHLDAPLSYEGMEEVGTMLGTATPMVFDETTSVVRAITGWLDFYKHESCGKCTPCREGTWWIDQLLHRSQSGHRQDRGTSPRSTSCVPRSLAVPSARLATRRLRPTRRRSICSAVSSAGTHTAADDLFNPAASVVFFGVKTS